MRRKRMNMTFHFFIDDMAPFRALDFRECMTMVFDFLEHTPSTMVDRFAVLLMPYEFSRYYLHRRHSVPSKESFRQSFIYCTGHRLDRQITVKLHANGELTPAEMAVVEHVRTHGSFDLSQLTEALGHHPTREEEQEVSTFLSRMNDKNWQRLLRDNTKHAH